MANDRILPPGSAQLGSDIRAGIDYYLKENPGSFWNEASILYPTALMYLTLAFHPGLAANYLDGKALAKMTSGRLALVPVSSQNGVIIATVSHYCTPREECEYPPSIKRICFSTNVLCRRPHGRRRRYSEVG